MIKTKYLIISLLALFLTAGARLNQTEALEMIDYGSREKKQIALTFDADMTYGMKKRLTNGEVKNWYNEALKNYLVENKIPATIFITGLWAETYPQVVKELATYPFLEIGNHSYSHPSFAGYCYGLPQIFHRNADHEIIDTNLMLNKLTGKTISLFRFPGGCHSQIDLERLEKLKMLPIGWDVSSNDGFNKNTDNIVKRVLDKITNGSIVVFHFHGGRNAPKTLEALKIIVPKMQEKGFRLVTVSQLVN